MQIAFISLNQEKLPDPVVPIGLLYVMANTPDRHGKLLWDLCFEEDRRKYLAVQVARHQPDLIAVGMRNIQNADYSDSRTNLDDYKGILDHLRTISGAPIVLGGSGFSVMPDKIMAYLRPDFGISGEGEREFARLVEALEAGGQDFSGVRNLYYFQGPKLRFTGPAPEFLDVNAIAPPAFSLIDPRYYERSGIASFQTKRGCPLACTYCTYPKIEGNRKRLRDPNAIAAEIAAAVVERPAINHYFIVDSVFNLPTHHAMDVCRAMIERGLRTPWTCYANPLGFDAPLAGLMREAGCVGIEMGSDSGTDEILGRLKKGFTTRQIREVGRICTEAGIKDCHTFILGTPGETLDDVRRTLDFIIDLDPHSAILMAWTDDEEAVDPVCALDRRRFREKIIALFDAYKLKYPWWIIPTLDYNFGTKLFRLLRKCGLEGPLWQHCRVELGELSASAARKRPSGEPPGVPDLRRAGWDKNR